MRGTAGWRGCRCEAHGRNARGAGRVEVCGAARTHVGLQMRGAAGTRAWVCVWKCGTAGTRAW
eukprot:4318121-Prymnesium_polylepis.2